MRKFNSLEARLTRRNWLVLAGAGLSACGGGGSSMLAGVPGTGGTGAPMFAQGSISGFGSVILNGIRFDDMQATVQIDGMVATSAQLRLGMVADVQGARGSDPTVGLASRIDVWSIARGAITSITPISNTFEVAGMKVQTDSNTSLDGISSTTALQTGMLVHVWGLPVGSNSDHWLATRIEVLTDILNSSVISTGVVKLERSQVTLNDLVLRGALVETLRDGQMVWVVGTLNSGGDTLELIAVDPFNAWALDQSQREVEMEGFVTSILSSSRFMMGHIEVDASQAIYTPVGTALELNSRIEVYGNWSNNVLIAREVEREVDDALNVVEISARIDSFTSVANFVLRGQRCDASHAIFNRGMAADLRKGAKVKITGLKAGDMVNVLGLEFEA